MLSAKSSIIELDMSELEDVLRRAEGQLNEKDYALVKALIESYAYLAELVNDKHTTVARLRKLLFGSKTEKTAAIVGQPPEAERQSTSAETTSSNAPADVASQTSAAASPAGGHGRNGAEAYTGAEKIEIPHPSLAPGDPCPECEQGTVYETGRSGVLVRLVGQAPVGAKVYYLQKLRCNLCGEVFTAAPPDGAGAKKYDATVGSMIALLKYGTGMPFHRAETLQASLGIPLPASTQWDIVAALAERIESVFEELTRHAAQGEVLHNDDTTVKILALMGARRASPAQDDTAGQPAPTERKGLFTSGIVATGEGRKIALFLSGHRHAGENLAGVLKRRAVERPPPIQMCDALSRNLPANLQTLVANCLAHGRRQFVDVAEQFPNECRRVLESLAVVYRNDALARERKLSPEERLSFHQVQSGPTLAELRIWLKGQLDERRVEPNSGLGKAMAYLLRHWEKLTLFLRVPGAPLDNNICERALKKAIRHRRNSLFYKTQNGADVGDMFMSLIHTCELNGANPFDYLTELERQADQAVSNPQDWMPWNYRQMLADTCAFVL